MLRFGGITGTVRDENEVGIADQDVAAYTNTEPPYVVSRATTDDRGVFRISGLYPGSYLVRTTGNRDFDIAYMQYRHLDERHLRVPLTRDKSRPHAR